MANYDNYFGPMDANFSAVWDAAMEARKEIAEALKTVPYDNSGIDHCQLKIGNNVNFCAYIVGRERPFGDDIYEKAVDWDDKDATVEDIKACTARAIAKLKGKTKEGRIAELKGQLAALENEVAELEREA